MDQETTGSKTKADNKPNPDASSSDLLIDKSSEADAIDKEEEETRVITLDTIIRKGLVEQMPMTAKDINSIVALSMQKEREKQAADRLRIAALHSRHADYDEEDETDSSDYDSSNENEFESSLPATNKPLVVNKELEITKEPPSVIQKAPKESRSILTDDLKGTQDDPEDFELKSGDLHYSESNPSDYSESENRLSSIQSSLKKRLNFSRKRELSPIVERMIAKEPDEATAKKQRIDLSNSCTDSKRNAILLQCSSGFGSSGKVASPQLSLVDNESLKSLSPPHLHPDTNESSEHSGDRHIDIASMLEVQHSMDEDTTLNEINGTEPEGKPIVVKLERESPVENMLEIHHVEDYLPDDHIISQTKNGRGGRKLKSTFNRSTYSEPKPPTKTTANKRIKKTKTTQNIDSIRPIIETAKTATSPSSSVGTLKQRQSQKRDKRQTVRSNPVYAELSESSCDNMDAGVSKPKTLATATTSTTPLTTPSTPKVHWKTQLKMQRKKSEPSKLDMPTSKVVAVDKEPSTKTVAIPVEEDPLKDDNEPEIVEKHKEKEVPVVNKIIEPPHHQKRIPKLKYGSFNFTERRGGLSKGPKMVLKYKKKYKKKTKLQRQSLGVKFVSAGEEPLVIHETGLVAVPPSKLTPRVRKVSKERTTSVNQAEAILKPDQTIKTVKSEQPANIGRSIKERNRVLLEILDQRSCEIRNLKLRLANMLRSSGSNPLDQAHQSLKTIARERQAIVKTESCSEPGTLDWSPDELAQAFSLQKLNRKLYANLQQRYSLPLPLPTEIDQFVGKVRIESNRHLLDNVLNMLRFDGEHMTELERVAVLQISQFPLKHSYTYVEKSDLILHSNSDHLFVILVRGLIGDWQHPIYVNSSDEGLTSIIKSAVIKLNDIQFNVIACCSRFEDIASSSIWTELGVCRGYSYFSHPVTNDPIYTFYYVDDILRSVHHHLMTKNGFHTDTGTTINREPVDALLQNNPAAKTLSVELNAPSTFFTAKTIDLLRLLRPEHYTSCSDFVDVFAGFQQMMRTTNYGGENLEHQLQVLSHVQLQLYKLKCHGTNIIPEFKHATTHSIESLKLLQHSMRQKYGVDMFPGRSVSEDYLRLLITSPLPIEQAMQVIRTVSFPHKSHVTPPAELFDVATPEQNLVQQMIENIAQKYNLADKTKFITDLRRIEDKFTTLWTPFFAGNVHVLRDTLGKVKPSASLEGAVEFVRKRIELRVEQVNALGGIVEWTNYHSSQQNV